MVAVCACAVEHQEEVERTVCDVFAASAAVGWPQTVVCLYAPDYVPPSTRLSTTQRLWIALTRALPSSEVRVPLAEAPFYRPGRSWSLL